MSISTSNIYVNLNYKVMSVSTTTKLRLSLQQSYVYLNNKVTFIYLSQSHHQSDVCLKNKITSILTTKLRLSQQQDHVYLKG
jgi:hypothetical protein